MTRFSLVLPWKALLVSSFLILSSPSCNYYYCHGFSVPSSRKTTTNTPSKNKYKYYYRKSNDRVVVFPTQLEDWEHGNVEDWLRTIGFGRYALTFASDFDDIGVDGDRLVYLGTADQLDHIEYQLSLIGVENESDQQVLGAAIIELVAGSEISLELLESLAKNVPDENRDDNDCNDDDDKDDDPRAVDCEDILNYEI